MERKLTKRWLWQEMIVLSLIYTILVLLTISIFPVFYHLILPDLQQDIFLIVSSSFVFSTVVGELIKLSVNMSFTKEYPEGIEVYNLDGVSESYLWSKLKVSNYPDSKYIIHPAMDDAEKMLKDEILQKRIVYITGSAGTGKSTAAVQVTKLFQKRNQGSVLKRPIFRRPKLVLITETIVGSHEIRFPKFSEPILVLIDDYQFLKEKNQISVRQLIDQFARNERKGLVVCISREHPYHPSPVTVTPIIVDCNVQTTEAYMTFIVDLIFHGSLRNNITISDEVTLALVKKVIALNEPPLYVIFLLMDHKDSELTMTDLEKPLEGMRGLCERSWEKLSSSQKDLVRAIMILKRISYSSEKFIVSGLYRCFFEREDFNNVRPKMEHSIWFSTRNEVLVAPDSPYEIVDYDDFENHLVELANLIIGNHHEENKTACFEQIEKYYYIAGNLAVYLKDSHVKLAENCFRKVVEISIVQNDMKSASLAWYNLGTVFTELKKYDKAEEAFNEAIRIGHDYTSSWNSLGNLLSTLKRFKKAEEAYKNALTIDPKDRMVLYNLGLLFIEMKKPKEALRAFKKASESDPDSVHTWFNLGTLLAELKKFDEAEEALRKALGIDPEYAKAWYNLGLLLVDMNRFSEAEEPFRRATDADPDYCLSWFNLGLLLIKLERFDEAEKAYRKGLAVDPQDSGIWYDLGVLLYGQDKFKDAEDAYRKALEIDPEYAPAWHNLGMVLISMTRLEEADVIFRKALEIDPEYALAWYNLGLLLIRMGNEEEGCKAVRNAGENVHLFEDLIEGFRDLVEELVKKCDENEEKTD